MKEESRKTRKEKLLCQMQRLLIDTLRKWHYSNKDHEEEERKKRKKPN